MNTQTDQDLHSQLQQAQREAAYYQKLARESGERRLKESEELSHLIAQLRQTEKELVHARDELEQRVQERTTELAATNARLEHEQHNLEARVQQRTQEILDMQRGRLRELAAPLIPLMEGVVIMPLIGVIDPERAQQVMDTLLAGLATHRATAAILDITGVRAMDAQIAQAFLQTARACRLLGTKVILTGIQPAIAQMLVRAGADLGDIVTRGTLQAGIAEVLRETTQKRRI